ncbi:MAG: sulfatase-like hydrolase/transferase [Boseongicola sp.]
MSTAKNLLIIMSDEHRRDAMGLMGNPPIQTPHLDALGAGGAVFKNAYTPSPMCVPARAAIACGDYVHRIRYWDSATPYDGRRPSWMHALRDAGVEVVSIGKLHFRSTDDDNGFSREILSMHVVDGVGWPPGLLRKSPPAYDAAEELARDVGTGESDYTRYDRAVTQAAVNWLTNQARKSERWAAFVSLVSPHYPLTAPESFAALYDPASIDPPIAHAKGARPRHAELDRIAAFYDYDRYFDKEGVLRARAAYYGLVSFMDACVGQILSALKVSGQANETLVVYVSDHGDMLGDHGFWTKQVMYEGSAGVPMILSGPCVKAGRRVSTAVSLLDLAPTATEAVAGEAWDGPGNSLIAIASDDNNPDRTVFSEYHDGGSTTGTFMVRWRNWKYVHYVSEAPQLFDLVKDPRELNDLGCSEATTAREARAEGEKRLRLICDPDAVNERCFQDQERRIEELGGEAACRGLRAFNHTPAPKI